MGKSVVIFSGKITKMALFILEKLARMTKDKKYVKGKVFIIIKTLRKTLSTVILCQMCHLEKSMLEIGRLIFSTGMVCIYSLLESAMKEI